ncbi:hypothetical protein [Desulfosporosinus sp.]|uniref:hypothetical protein n=1 Tax=Desulfosporosinus sp. TaxID=157907 RepID=UPI0025BFC2A5|nr:hypothetical protein [Desulfosporosinus sp.]MBC2722362.1 hypothetical protein [Desulfosporosinus sp.]
MLPVRSWSVVSGSDPVMKATLALCHPEGGTTEGSSTSQAKLFARKILRYAQNDKHRTTNLLS